MLRFDSQVALVTGAGHGLGRVYALQLAARGCKVVVNDVGGDPRGMNSDHSVAQQVVAEIRQSGGEALANTDSVASFASGAKIVADALNAFGRIDIVVSNAGILRKSSFEKMTEEDFESVLAVHLRGAVSVAQPAFRWMKANGGGNFVFTTSSVGLFGGLGGASYGTAKSALIGLMGAIAAEGARYGVRANAVSPTAGTRMAAAGGTLPESPIDADPSADMLSPARVSPVVLALAHSSCAISGEIFNAAGGWLSRTVLAVSKGTTLEDYSPEAVAAQWDAIRDTTHAQFPANIMEYWAIAQRAISPTNAQ